MAIIPIPRIPIHIRVATMEDLPFMDSLQKKNGKALGYWTTRQFEGYIAERAVLVAEDASTRAPLGYLISKDRYLKRDELGVIYQLCVRDDVQRGLIGASLVKTAFERSAYGCRLYCLWCAQDLDANYFWESLGFVPIAFRTGSDKKKRIHIFWQKKICAGDEPAGDTKWWYPFQTAGGALRADRVVFPIPEGVHWSEVKGVEIPTTSEPREKRLLPAPRTRHGRGARVTTNAPGPGKVGILVGGRIKYVDRPGYIPPAVAPLVPLEQDPVTKARSAKPQAACPERSRRAKIDPRFLRAARELRDRWFEHINANGGANLPAAQGKYQLARTPGVATAAGELPAPDTAFLPAA